MLLTLLELKFIQVNLERFRFTSKGKKINYEGATGVTFTSVGEAEGSFLEQEVKGGKFKLKTKIIFYLNSKNPSNLIAGVFF